MKSLVFVCVLAAQSPPPPGAPDFVVAPNGNDGAAGTEAAPFATLEKAVAAMRGSTTKKTLLRGGTYFLRGKTVTIDARDHGVQILNYPGERPVLSGGSPVTGWTLAEPAKGIWSAALPAEVESVGAVTVNGEWYEAARTPNRDPRNPPGAIELVRHREVPGSAQAALGAQL
jgi:hypothetical protein